MDCWHCLCVVWRVGSRCAAKDPRMKAVPEAAAAVQDPPTSPGRSTAPITAITQHSPAPHTPLRPLREVKEPLAEEAAGHIERIELEDRGEKGT